MNFALGIPVERQSNPAPSYLAGKLSKLYHDFSQHCNKPWPAKSRN
jgi:hypothetical protein